MTEAVVAEGADDADIPSSAIESGRGILVTSSDRALVAGNRLSAMGKELNGAVGLRMVLSGVSVLCTHDRHRRLRRACNT